MKAAASAKPTFHEIDEVVLGSLDFPGLKYWAWIAFLVLGVGTGASCWTYQIYTGLGVTGLRQPNMWATYITNFVFWVGIAHSGTLISAILFLFRSRWRTGVFRAAEASTIFAVMTAGLFPLIHIGRVWFFYWLLPYPNERWLQPNFRSPLVWDAFAVSTYLTISVLFFTMGLIPDFAVVRENAKGLRKLIFTGLAAGWQGTEQQWRHYSAAYLLLAAFATPLVLSVHSVVSWDFAMGQLAGWHSTIFAPYFVAGAIFSGCAMVLTLLIPMRKWMKLETLLTPWHFDNLAKVVLFTSLIVSYAYLVEGFLQWYGADPLEMTTFHWRFHGRWAGFYWMMVLCNCVIPLLLFSQQVRLNGIALWIISIFVNIGMWLERFVIIAGSLATNPMPSQWGFYQIRPVEIGITFGALCWFLLLFSLFSKFAPIMSMTELKEGAGWLRQALQQETARAA